MSYMQKRVEVRFVNDEVENEYLSLSNEDRIKKKINWVIERLKETPDFGQSISKKLIPVKYKDQGADNAFWVELSKESRLIYTLSSEIKNEIIATILEWFISHKDYEKRFGY